MAIFITGATGFIGKRLAFKLLERGETVHLLARSPEKAKDLQHPNLKIFKGDILEANSLLPGMMDCDRVIHMASYVDIWAKDPATPYLINVQGTVNVMEAAKSAGVKRVVCTSTAGTFGPSSGLPVSESTVRTVPFFVEYETSKYMAEERALRYTNYGLEVVIVNPTRVFGPGELSKSNSFVKLMQMYLYKGRTVVPGKGDKSGNFVFVEDVINGHLLAMEKGRSGERYILGGDNATMREFFNLVGEISGKKSSIWGIPIFILFGFAGFQEWKARWFNSPPLITRGFARRYLAHWNNSVEKAKIELGYQPLPLREGISLTIDWLKEKYGPF